MTDLPMCETPGCEFAAGHEREHPCGRNLARSWSGVANIAYCPQHGLHGQRDTCFDCGAPVEQIPMAPVTGMTDHHGPKFIESAHPLVRVRWLDSCVQNGQVDDEDLPTPSEMETVGWLAHKGGDHIVVTRDFSPSPTSYSWRASVAIPCAHILDAEKLSCGSWAALDTTNLGQR